MGGGSKRRILADRVGGGGWAGRVGGGFVSRGGAAGEAGWVVHRDPDIEGSDCGAPGVRTYSADGGELRGVGGRHDCERGFRPGAAVLRRNGVSPGGSGPR